MLTDERHELKKFNGQSFEFAEVFDCRVHEGIVYIEQYGEGEFPLDHIKTEKQFRKLYEILTGKNPELIKK